MIIWADPEKKKEIFKKSTEIKSDYRKIVLEDKVDLIVLIMRPGSNVFTTFIR